MGNVTFKIVNEELFSEKVIDIDTSGLKSKGTNEKGKSLGFYGSFEIEAEDDRGRVTATGNFGVNDYKDDFGFILISK